MSYLKKATDKDYLYVLRRTLPPWRWREGLDELLECARKYRIDEVCIKIDTGTFTHFFPSFEWLKDYQRVLLTVHEELERAGIRYSLNPNVLQGHDDRGRNIAAQHPDWQMITGPDGVRCTDCACMSSPGWREYFKRQWTIYAETKPEVIWLEDDIRTFGHSPVTFGCFCDEHMRRFNEKYGTDYSREQLYALITNAGDPSPVRVQWLDLQSDMICEIVTLAEQTVHAVSSDTIIGLMSSGPELHEVEGRDWERFHSIMAGPEGIPVASRPPMGAYREGALADTLYYTANMSRLTRTAFKHPTIEEAEIENYPYTGFNKSNLFTFLQSSVAIGTGCDAVTLNLFDHCGTPMQVTEDILESLASHKDFLSGLKERVGSKGKGSGVRCYYSPRSARSKKLPSGANLFDLRGETTNWSLPLQSMGFAVTFDESSVTALAGQDIRAASDSEIKSIFSGAVLCDATAFLTLHEMGYGHLLGGTPRSQFKLATTRALAGEHYYNTDFGGIKGHCFSMAVHKGFPLFVEIEKDPSAIEISEIVDPDFKRIFPGTYLFTNELGGRVAILPLEVGKLSPGFSDPTRKMMLYHILRHLAQDQIPLFVSGNRNLLALRSDFEGYSVCGFYNLSLDPLENLHAEVSLADREVIGAEWLTKEGNWQKFDQYSCAGSKLQIGIDRLSFENPLYFTIEYRE